MQSLENEMELFLLLDTETGGLDSHKNSLLSMYAAIVSRDENGNMTIHSELDIKVKPDNNGPYNVTAGAMKVNKIDLSKHDTEALCLTEASKALYSFIHHASNGGENKLIPIGHNVKFDISFITNQLLKESLWNNHVSYHSLDTVTLALALKIQGKLPKNTQLSLGRLAKTLNIEIDKTELHTAKYDALLCMEAAKVMLNM